jgi:hypothetical protein
LIARLTLAACLIVPVAAAAQTAAPPAGEPEPVSIDLSSWRIERNTSLAAAAGATISRLSDAALDQAFGKPTGTRGRDIASRIARLYVVQAPIASLTHTLTHEFGHIARAQEAGAGRISIQVHPWPWPVPVTGATSRPVDPFFETPPDRLTTLAAGEEAAGLLADRVIDAIYAEDSARYSDWLLTIYASLDMPMYTWTHIRRSQLRSEEAFFTSPRLQSDPAEYALVFTELEAFSSPHGEFTFAAVRRNANRLRNGVWLDLLDFSLWAGMWQTITYVLTGSERLPNPALIIGGVRLVPGAHFTITPIGMEKGVDVRSVFRRQVLRTGIRWTSTPTRKTLWGATAAVIPRSGRWLSVRIAADVWQRERMGPGFRLEAGPEYTRKGSHRFAGVGGSIGYKSSGYLAGAPFRAGFMASIGPRIRF